MTAPDLVEVIEAAMLAHTATWQSSGDFCEHAWLECECGETWDVENEPAAHLAHQARAVLAAITEAGAVEWALQTKTFRDGDFDQTYTRDGTYRKPFTEEQATNHPWLNPRSPVPTRVVSRVVGPWTAVEG